eukprot:UN08772
MPDIVNRIIEDAKTQWDDVNFLRQNITLQRMCTHENNNGTTCQTSCRNNSTPDDLQLAQYHCSRCLTFCGLTATLHGAILGHIDEVEAAVYTPPVFTQHDDTVLITPGTTQIASNNSNNNTNII